MLLKVLVRFTYLFIFLKKFSISFSFYFIFTPHLETAFLFYSINTEHYFLVVAMSKAADYSIYDISPLPCIAIMFYTRTHIFTFIFLFFVVFFFYSWWIYRVIIFFILSFNRLLTSLLSLFMNSNKPLKLLQNNARPYGIRILILLKTVFEFRKIY